MVKLNKKQRAELFAMFDGKCAYCGCALVKWHADHVEPVYRRSKYVRGAKSWRLVSTGECDLPSNDHIGNFMPSCAPCNIHKGALTLESWRVTLQISLRILRDNYSVFRHAERFGLLAETGTKVEFYFEKCGRREN